MTDPSPDDDLEGFVPFAQGAVVCPCGAEIPVPVLARLGLEGEDMVLEVEPDMTELWSHSWTHEAEGATNTEGGPE